MSLFFYMMCFLKRLCCFVLGDINWNPPCQMSILDWLLGLTPSQQVICQTYLFCFRCRLHCKVQCVHCRPENKNTEAEGQIMPWPENEWKWLHLEKKNLYSRVWVYMWPWFVQRVIVFFLVFEELRLRQYLKMMILLAIGTGQQNCLEDSPVFTHFH